VVELATVILIAGVLLGVATLSFSEINRGVRISGATKQVEEAINRAKTSARQENVRTRIVIHSSSEPHPNTYEFYTNVPGEGGGWEMKPVDKSAGEEGVYREGEHVYVPVANGVMVEQGCSIDFQPMGTSLKATPGAVTLRVGHRTSTITVDEAGRITLQ
jgi:Tfp pilus assembly protein FimT